MQLQHEQGYVDDQSLKELSQRRKVPLYRLEGLVSFYTSFRRDPPPKITVQVCRDVSCIMQCSSRQRREFLRTIGQGDDVEVREVSCLGRCDTAPAVVVNDHPVAPLTLFDADKLGGWCDVRSSNEDDVRGNWCCDPYADVEEHYTTVKSLITKRVELAVVCIQRLIDSGLRGMGGAGFPTGKKWDLVARESSETKYVICNADESEPGTFKDRVILSELPHLVIEGMILAGLTIGAERGIIYLRHEYGPERRRIEVALDNARRLGALGKNVMGSGHAFDVEVFESPGGYILGEETALLEALEDKRGEPRNKPPYPGTFGLEGKPTLINNVETLAMATTIIHHDVPWWRDQGIGDFSGLKFISISGDVERPGVCEIPVGTTVAEAIELSGGMADGKSLKAFLPGGASSNFLASKHANVPLEFEAMRSVGSMLGTGAVIVFSEDRNLFELATNIVTFFRNESCGKCVPCRTGSERAVQMLEQVISGETDVTELDVLSGLAETLEQTSICGLGQVALNPILSSMKFFPDDITR